MVLGKSIRIYLKEGTVSGIKLAEVLNHTIQAISCPRNKLLELNEFFHKEAHRPGLYFLLGDDGTNKVKAYIGEAENVWERLKTQDIKKEFWTEVILFTSKDDNLTKSHVKFLESRTITIATSVDRYSLENNHFPSLNTLPQPDIDLMEDFILNIKLLTGTLGHKVLEDPILPILVESIQAVENKRTSNLKLKLVAKGIEANALQTDEGLVVLTGSLVSETESKNYGYKTLRDKLISEQIIGRDIHHKLSFTKNYLFKNPSPAAAVIVGHSINGRDHWKDINGRSLNEIEKSEVK